MANGLRIRTCMSESTRKFRKMKYTRVFETIRRPEIVLFIATNASLQDPIQLRYRLTCQIVKQTGIYRELAIPQRRQKHWLNEQNNTPSTSLHF